MKRVLLGALAMVLVGAGSWIAATHVESPNQAASHAAPPKPVPVVARVTSGYLAGRVTVSVTAQQDVVVPVPTPTPLNGETVTFVASGPGAVVAPGAVLLRANGRPVFVVPGRFPLYRDLQGGDIGDDVAELQAGLAASGFPSTDAPGVFDWGTKDAITRMYSAAGYTPPGTEPDVAKQLDALEAQIAAATSPAEAAALAQQRSGLVGQSGSRALLSEIVVVAGLPAKVATVAGIGTRLEADKPLATLGAGPVVLAATMPSPAAQVLSVGATGEVTGSGSRGERVEITSITPDGADSSRISMKVLTGSFKIGTTHVVVVDNPQAAKAESTLVPVAAVVMRGGRSYVYRRDGAVFREVEVTVTGSRGGTDAIVVVSGNSSLEPRVEVRTSG